MNKIDTITRITAKVLDKYRNSIPRKAFIDAMDRVKEEAIEASTVNVGQPVPGIELIKRPDITAGELADMLHGSCPPFSTSCSVCCDHIREQQVAVDHRRPDLQRGQQPLRDLRQHHHCRHCLRCRQGAALRLRAGT